MQTLLYYGAVLLVQNTVAKSYNPYNTFYNKENTVMRPFGSILLVSAYKV